MAEYRDNTVNPVLAGDDVEAFSQLVRDHHHTLLAATRSLVGDDVAHEVVQRAWIKAYNAICKFEGRSSIKTWLVSIAVNEARMYLRQHKREVSLDQMQTNDNEPLADRFKPGGLWAKPPAQWAEDSPDELLTREELLDCLRKILAGMPANQRALIELRDMNEMAFDDICNELELTASNARVLLHRARTHLYRFLDKFEETGEC